MSLEKQLESAVDVTPRRAKVKGGRVDRTSLCTPMSLKEKICENNDHNLKVSVAEKAAGERQKEMNLRDFKCFSPEQQACRNKNFFLEDSSYAFNAD